MSKLIFFTEFTMSHMYSRKSPKLDFHLSEDKKDLSVIISFGASAPKHMPLDKSDLSELISRLKIIEKKMNYGNRKI